MGIPSAASLLGLLDVLNERSMGKGLSEPRNICATTSLHLSLPHPPEGGWVPKQGDPPPANPGQEGSPPPGTSRRDTPRLQQPPAHLGRGVPSSCPRSRGALVPPPGRAMGTAPALSSSSLPPSSGSPRPRAPPKALGKGFRRLGAGWCLGQGEAPQEYTAQHSPRVEMWAPP